MIDDISRQLVNSGSVERAQISGYSQEEIQHIEKSLNIVLNAEARDFLRVMGVRAGSFLKGTDIFSQNYVELRSDALELLVENNFSPDLLEKKFVFAMHQGYEFVFVNLVGSDVGSVGQFVEGGGFHENVWGNIETYLMQFLKQFNSRGQSA